MALTWKNVDAPNFNGAGALFESAQNSFNSSLDMLRQASDRAAAQRKADASARMLSGLAGVQRGGVADFLSNQDAAMLTPEALQIALGQEDVLAGRASKEVELQNAQGDLAWETGSREGMLASAAAIAEAERLGMTGNREGAFDLLQGLTGHGALAAQNANAMGRVSSGFGNFQDQRGREDSFAQTIDARNTKEFGRNFIFDNIIPNSLNRSEAENNIMQNENLTPKEKEAALSALGNVSDQQIEQINPDQLGALELNPDMSTKFTNIQNDASFINADIQNRRSANPLVRFADHMKNIGEVRKNPESAPQSSADLLSAGGVSAGHWTGWTGANQTIDSVIKDLASDGLTVSRDEVVAAMRATAETSSIAFKDNLVDNIDATKSLLRQTKDPALMRSALGEMQSYDNESAQLSKFAEKISKLDDKYKQQVNKGLTDKAAKTRDDIQNLINEAEQYTSNYLKSEGDKASKEVQAEMQKDPNGPDAPREIVQAAMLSRAAAVAEAAKRRNQQPVSVILPNGVISQEIPAVMGDGSTMGPAEWNNNSFWPRFR